MAMCAKQAANLVGEDLFANLELQELRPPRLQHARTQSASRCRSEAQKCHLGEACQRAGARTKRCCARATPSARLTCPGMSKLLRLSLLAGRTGGSSDGSNERMLLTPEHFRGSSDGSNGESNGWMRWTPLLAFLTLWLWTAAHSAAIVAMRSTSSLEEHYAQALILTSSCRTIRRAETHETVKVPI